MSDPTEAILTLIHTHFTTHQTSHAPTKRTAITTLSPSSLRSAASLRDELSQYSLHCQLNDLSLHNNEDDVDIPHLIVQTILHCVDCAMYAIHENKEAAESAHATLELACAYACGDKTTALAVVNRTMDYVTVSKDTVRMEACDMLSWFAGQFLSVPASILKGKKSREVKLEEWKLECAIAAGKALLSRLTDKITKVRSAALSACVHFFKSTKEELAEIASELEEAVMWLASNDTSAANRALAVSCLPAEKNVANIVLRLKDVDVKVREAALEALREKVGVNDLGEEVMVEILRNGLTKR